jgi:hypothetical protein
MLPEFQLSDMLSYRSARVALRFSKTALLPSGLKPGRLLLSLTAKKLGSNL